jgi:hypothetical protein
MPNKSSSNEEGGSDLENPGPNSCPALAILSTLDIIQ